jgi:hypothetical protein
MDEKFTIMVYQDLVKIVYNDAQQLAGNLFNKFFIKKIKFPDENIVIRYIVRWRVKRFIKKKLARIVNDIFEFYDFDTISYKKLFPKD